MKSQILIPARSAMAETQRMNILSNDLVRRLSNVKIEQSEEGEVEKVIEQYTKQLKTSGYDRKKCREVVTSGVVGWIRKRRRREEQGMNFYRGAASTLRLRIRKKLLDPVTWFKDKDKAADNDEIKVEKRDTRKKRKIEELEDRKRKRDPTEAKAVMFCR